MAIWVPATNKSCFLVYLNCYLYYYTCTHNRLRNKHISIYQYSLTPCSSETRSFCLVLLLDGVRSSSGQYISPSGLLRELPPHSSSSNIAGTSYVSSNLDSIFWNASVFWSNLIGETFPTALITQ